MRDIYAGIDIVYYGNPQRLEFDFIVAPGADPGQIELAYEGTDTPRVDRAGNLVLTTQLGDLIQQKPRVYQVVNGTRVVVETRYRLHGRKAGFVLARHDPRRELVIDPALVYSTYLGGVSIDQGEGIAVDASGAVYLGGYTTSLDFPTVNAFQTTFSSGFVSKLNAAGTALAYSTYLGGTGFNFVAAVAVDAAGSAYVTGPTSSPDFPLRNPIQGMLGGSFDAFVTKLSPAGNSLVYSTYLGGSSTDFSVPDGVAIDAAGSVYVGGSTDSPNFPTRSPLQPGLAGLSDAFVTKINPSGSSLVFSTYLGGSGNDQANGTAVDAIGNVHVTGVTSSTNFPVANPIQGTFAGGPQDLFAVKLNPAGTAFLYSTYLGGSGNDLGASVSIDSAGATYLTGCTDSTNFPLLRPLQATVAGALDAYITKLDAAGRLLYSTYLGGSSDDCGFDVTVDLAGSAHVTGFTNSTNFPTVAPIQPSLAGVSDAMVVKLNASGTGLLFSSYLGGSLTDEGHSIAVDSTGLIYVTGYTDSLNFPIRGAFQSVLAGTRDAFLTKLKVLSITNTSPLAAGTVGTAYNVNFGAFGGPAPFQWTLTGGSPPPGLSFSSGGVLSGTPSASGTYSFTVDVRDSLNDTHSLPFSISINPRLVITSGSPLNPGTVGFLFSQTFQATGGSPPLVWSLGGAPPGLALSPGGVLSGTPSTAGTFVFPVQVTDAIGATATINARVTINPPPVITTTALPAGLVGAPYSQTLAAAGGSPPLFWLLLSGSFPPGLTLTGAGAISGAPTTAGTYNFTIQLSDSGGAAITAVFTITITASPLAITTTSLPAGLVGATYSQTLAASGGAPPYRWTLAGGSPGPGLSIDPAGRNLGHAVGRWYVPVHRAGHRRAGRLAHAGARVDRQPDPDAGGRADGLELHDDHWRTVAGAAEHRRDLEHRRAAFIAVVQHFERRRMAERGAQPNQCARSRLDHAGDRRAGRRKLSGHGGGVGPGLGAFVGGDRGRLPRRSAAAARRGGRGSRRSGRADVFAAGRRRPGDADDLAGPSGDRHRLHGRGDDRQRRLVAECVAFERPHRGQPGFDPRGHRRPKQSPSVGVQRDG